jgi:hypothetical protein
VLVRDMVVSFRLMSRRSNRAFFRTAYEPAQKFLRVPFANS